MEKFYKNYLDCGQLIQQTLVKDDDDKMVQELRFLDQSIFKGEVYLDEETRLVYKEGLGQLDRN